MWSFIIVFFILGVVGIISPKISWYLTNWWKFDGQVEPSKASLLLYRLGGVIFLILAIIIYLVEN